MLDRRQVRERAHGLTAHILGLFLLGVGASLGISKTAADLLSGMLSIPEYPAVLLRETIRDWLSWGRSRSAIQAEIEALRGENAELRVLNATLANERIRVELSALEARKDVARITLRAPMSWWNEIRIDKGEGDGVIVGLPVFHNGYLAGRISSVSLLSSWVELLTSPSLMIPVVVEETRELGVVMGNGSGSVFLNYIPAGRGSMKGMKVSTALIGEQLPPGLPIGVIAEELETTPDGYATYRIAPGADFSKLYSVSLLAKPEGASR